MGIDPAFKITIFGIIAMCAVPVLGYASTILGRLLRERRIRRSRQRRSPDNTEAPIEVHDVSFKIKPSEVRFANKFDPNKDDEPKVSFNYSSKYNRALVWTYWDIPERLSLEITISEADFNFWYYPSNRCFEFLFSKKLILNDLIEFLLTIRSKTGMPNDKVYKSFLAMWRCVEVFDLQLENVRKIQDCILKLPLLLALYSLLLKGFNIKVEYNANIVIVDNMIYISPYQEKIWWEDYIYYYNYIEFLNKNFNISIPVEKYPEFIMDKKLEPVNNGLVISAF